MGVMIVEMNAGAALLYPEPSDLVRSGLNKPDKNVRLLLSPGWEPCSAKERAINSL